MADQGDTVVSYLGALNKMSHIQECQAAQERIIERAQNSPRLVRAMAKALCRISLERKQNVAYEFHRLCT